jgi:dethiobiotin synthetase
MSRVRGLFVTGTDTGVGKTVVAAAICAALRERGTAVAAWKPVVTGTDDPGPADHERLGRATGADPAEVTPHVFGPAVSPHLAAEQAGRPLEPAELLASARAAANGVDLLVVEGVGGLLVPLTPGYLVRDLARELDLPLVVAARPGLGTINHSLLTLEAARAVALRVAGIVLTPWPDEPSHMERSNRDTIARLGAVEVATLPSLSLTARPQRCQAPMPSSNRETIERLGRVPVATLPVVPEGEARPRDGAGLPLDAWLDV